MKHKISGLFFGSILLLVIITSGCVEYKDGTFSVKFQNENISTPLSMPLQKQYNNMTPEQLLQIIFVPKGLTELQEQNYEKNISKYDDQYVTWRLIIVDVTPNTIHLNDKGISCKLFVAEDQKSKLLSLNKGEYITVQGKPNTRIARVTSYKGMLNVELADGSIISKG